MSAELFAPRSRMPATLVTASNRQMAPHQCSTTTQTSPPPCLKLSAAARMLWHHRNCSTTFLLEVEVQQSYSCHGDNTKAARTGQQPTNQTRVEKESRFFFIVSQTFTSWTISTESNRFRDSCTCDDNKGTTLVRRNLRRLTYINLKGKKMSEIHSRAINLWSFRIYSLACSK
jgi:hypothetical protein